MDGLQADSEQASMIDAATNQTRAQMHGFSIPEKMCCNVIGFRNPVAGNKRCTGRAKLLRQELRESGIKKRFLFT